MIEDEVITLEGALKSYLKISDRQKVGLVSGSVSVPGLGFIWFSRKQASQLG